MSSVDCLNFRTAPRDLSSTDGVVDLRETSDVGKIGNILQAFLTRFTFAIIKWIIAVYRQRSFVLLMLVRLLDMFLILFKIKFTILDRSTLAETALQQAQMTVKGNEFSTTRMREHDRRREVYRLRLVRTMLSLH